MRLALCLFLLIAVGACGGVPLVPVI